MSLSTRPDILNHSTCLGTKTCKRRLGDVGCRCGAKAIKALQALLSRQEEKCSQLWEKQIAWESLELSGVRCFPTRVQVLPTQMQAVKAMEISLFLTTYRPQTFSNEKATQTSSNSLAPSIPLVPSALCPHFPSSCSDVPAAASMLAGVCVPGLSDLSPGQ